MRMRVRHWLLGSACVLVLAGSSPTGAQELMTNGGFEGSLGGWNGAGSFIYITGTSTSSVNGLPLNLPAGGSTHVLFENGGPDFAAIFQGFTVPANADFVDVTFDLFVADWSGLGPSGATLFSPSQVVRVDIQPFGASITDTSPSGVTRSLYLGVEAPLSSYVSYAFDISGDVVPGASYQIRFAQAAYLGTLITGIDNVSIVAAENSPPIANAGPDQSLMLGDTIQLDGSALDPDGDPITFWLWAVEESPGSNPPTLSNPFIPNPFISPVFPGTYVFSLTVSDGLDWSAPDTVIIDVIQNQPPVAVASASVTEGAAPLTVTFDGSASSDPEGGPLAYAWNFKDGSIPSSEQSPQHTFSSIGIYLVALTVTDDTGQFDTDTVLVRVLDAIPASALGPVGHLVLSGSVVIAGAFAASLRSRPRRSRQ